MTPWINLEEELRLRKKGWWERISTAIPELTPLAGTPQPPEHHAEGDVAIHTKLALEACSHNCDPDLLWVALLHDIGKPETTQTHSDGRITAHGHGKVGAEMASRILVRLEMPAERSKSIIWAVRHHLFHHSWQLKSAADLSKRQRSYLLNPDFPLLLEFLRIDSLATHGKTEKMQSYNFYKNLLQDVIRNVL